MCFGEEVNHVEQEKIPEVKKEEVKKPVSKFGFKRNRKLAFSTVGTPDYIAPEVFQ